MHGISPLYVSDHWGDTRLSELSSVTDCGPGDSLPDQNTLDDLISCCYQASLMREEDRPVRFRLILREPGCFDSKDGPPTGLHRLLFSEPQPFDEYKLQRLSPATDFYRSLIGVRHGATRVCRSGVLSTPGLDGSKMYTAEGWSHPLCRSRWLFT